MLHRFLLPEQQATEKLTTKLFDRDAAMIHQNLSEHAEDRAALYRLWDNDLKKMMHRRQVYASACLFCFLASAIAWNYGMVKTIWALYGVIVGVYLMLCAVKLMIDESNINYLMHHWDLQNTLKYFQSESRV
jgi:hypothetical protein